MIISVFKSNVEAQVTETDVEGTTQIEFTARPKDGEPWRIKGGDHMVGMWCVWTGVTLSKVVVIPKMTIFPPAFGGYSYGGGILRGW